VGPFYASITIKGTVRHDQIWWAIGVYEQPDGSPGLNLPVGVAFDAGRTEDGFQLFRLTLDDGTEVPGRFLIVDRVFRLWVDPPKGE
jgi:hypothetical protein